MGSSYVTFGRVPGLTAPAARVDAESELDALLAASPTYNAGVNVLVSLLLTLTGADFPISTAPNYTGYPSAFYAEGRYHVFWVDQRQRPNMSIYGARVEIDGTVLDPQGVELFTDSAGYRCNVAYDGTNFLVVTRNYC